MILFEKSATFWFASRYRVFADLERRRGESHVRSVMQTDSQSHGLMLQRLSRHGPVIAAMQETLDRAGAGGNCNISGTNHYHLLLERELDDLHGNEAALLFTSGYVSNWTTLGSLGAQLPGAVIFSDEKSHASMIEGIRHSLRAGPGLHAARGARSKR